MNKPLTIAWYELRNLLRSKGFLVLVFFPFAVCLVGLLLHSVFQARALARANNPQPDSRSSKPSLDGFGLVEITVDERPQGYVDQSGLIRIFPDAFDPDLLLSFPDETSARDALRAGQIRAYFIIPPDYKDDNPILGYTLDNNISSALKKDTSLDTLIEYNLANGDNQTLSILHRPILKLQEEDRATQEERTNIDPDRFQVSSTFMLPFGIAYVLWGIMLYPALLLGTALNRERGSRAFEVLLTSTSVEQMLIGKLAGLGLAGLLFLLSWLAAVMLYLRFGLVSLPGVESLSPAVLAWITLYTLGGFFFLGMLVATVGALLPNANDTSSMVSFLWLPGLAPFLLFQVLLDQPNGPLAVGMTFFPYTALGTVILRLTAAESVPLWQLILGLVLLLASSLLVIKIAARLLRAQTLLTGWSLKQLRFMSRRMPAHKS